MSHIHATATRLLTIVLAGAIAVKGEAQTPATSIELPPQSLSLSDLTAFRAPAANWQIVGSAATAPDGSSAFTTTPGIGVLFNAPTRTSHSSVATTWEHGDIDISFDVMLAQGSAPSMLLMGRYGVRLAESWVSGGPTMSTIGAIAPRWDESRGRGHEAFEGTQPRQNAARAPGLWQHVDIVFRTAKFDGPRKVANARFVKVAVNGVVVQDNVEVTGPTRGSAFADERATGPLLIEGDHGAVAIRNVRYKSYTGTARLSGLRYRVYEGDAMDASYATSHAPTREGAAGAISADLPLPQDKFAVAYDGTFDAPTAGKYRFALTLPWIGNDSTTRGPKVGGGALSVDGKPVVVNARGERRSYGDVDLAAGPHPFSVSFYKNRAGFNRRDVSIAVEGPGVEKRSLTDENSGGAFGAPVNPIMVAPEAEPIVLRSFVRHRNTKRVIVASVADPRGVHYSYDLAQGSLLYVWRGPFLETTQMWHERGEDQTAEPIGSVVTLPGTPGMAYLADAKAAWPDSVDERDFRRDGYQLDKTGHPTFLYHVRGTSVEDAMRPDLDGRSLHRELRIHAPAGASVQGLYVQLAQADHVVRQRDGSYAVGDRSYYITLPGNSAAPVLRRVNGMDELLVPVHFVRGEGSVGYSILW